MQANNSQGATGSSQGAPSYPQGAIAKQTGSKVEFNFREVSYNDSSANSNCCYCNRNIDASMPRFQLVCKHLLHRDCKEKTQPKNGSLTCMQCRQGTLQSAYFADQADLQSALACQRFFPILEGTHHEDTKYTNFMEQNGQHIIRWLDAVLDGSSIRLDDYNYMEDGFITICLESKPKCYNGKSFKSTIRLSSAHIQDDPDKLKFKLTEESILTHIVYNQVRIIYADSLFNRNSRFYIKMIDNVDIRASLDGEEVTIKLAKSIIDPYNMQFNFDALNHELAQNKVCDLTWWYSEVPKTKDGFHKSDDQKNPFEFLDEDNFQQQRITSIPTGKACFLNQTIRRLLERIPRQ